VLKILQSREFCPRGLVKVVFRQHYQVLALQQSVFNSISAPLHFLKSYKHGCSHCDAEGGKENKLVVDLGVLVLVDPKVDPGPRG
jgi:hypothetical protein